MSIARFLEITHKDRPAFIKESWIQGIPLRHLFMAGAVWRLAEDSPARPLRILEIGSWMGASALTWAEALHRFADGEGELTCVDPLIPYFDAEANKAALEDFDSAVVGGQKALMDEMSALLAEGYVHQILEHNLSTIKAPVKVRFERKRAVDLLPTLPDQSFDIVYVDGDHAYEAAAFDIGQAMRLVRDGGVVCGDDLELQLGDVDQDFARANASLDFPTDPKTRQQFHPGVTLAVGELLGPVSEYSGYWVMRRHGADFVPYALDGLPLMIPEHFPPSIKHSIINQLKSAKPGA